MSDAKSKAEARRQAILARGSNRLAKLTSTARGEDYAAAVHDDPPLPVLPSRESSPFAPSAPSDTPNPMPFDSLSSSMNTSQAQSPFATPFGPGGPQLDPQDPMAALFSMLGDPKATTGDDGAPPFPPFPMQTSPFAQSPQDSSASKIFSSSRWLFTLLRIISITSVLLYSVLVLEPRKYGEVDLHGLPFTSRWDRWGDLARMPNNTLNGLQKLPLLWTLIALQASIHILQSFIYPQLSHMPMLVNLALPHIPKSAAFLVRSGFAYLKIGSNLLDDVALSIFIIGAVVWVSCR